MAPAAIIDLGIHPIGLDSSNGLESLNGSSKVGCRDAPIHANRHLRVICMGAGASGIFLAYKLKQKFTDYTLKIFEKNSDIGGTWFENRYPGCACDIPAHNYTYTFEGKTDWSANYASAREIYQYYSDFIEKYGLGQYIYCNREIYHTQWNEESSEWVVRVRNTTSGFSQELRCDFFINAGGILNNWKWPAVPGITDFQGDLLHSAAWDDRLDVTDKRVGLIGNGSSGIQILPHLQQQAKHLTHFIRTPTWVSPALMMEYHKYTDEEKAKFKDDPAHHLEFRREVETELSASFPVLFQGSTTQETVKKQMAELMRQKLNNEELAEKLIPKFALGCRRFTPGVNYLESLTKPNVTVAYGEIDQVTPMSVISNGIEHELDVLVCATGFDTTFRPRFPIIGRHGSLADAWETEPRNYCSLAASGFPNYFMFLGPNCTIGNGPVIFAIEVAAEYMAQFFNRFQKEDISSFDPNRAAVDDFMAQKDLFMKRTVWDSGCRTWYKDPTINKVTALWPGSHLHFMETLAVPRFEDYDVRYRCANRFAYLGNGFSQTECDPEGDLAYYIRNRDGGETLTRPVMRTYNAKDIGDKMTANIEVPV